MKLRPSHLKGSDFGTAGGSHRIALTSGIPMSDSVVLFIWLTVSTSLPEFRYALTWFLIVAAFQSNDSFPPWGSEKSLLNATWYLWLVLSWPAGSMRCGSIRRCLDDLIFHVLKWPVELCTLFLHLLCVQLIPRARSIQPKFPEISVQNSMDRFGPTGKVSKKLVHLWRWSSFPGRTGWNFGRMDRAPRVAR